MQFLRTNTATRITVGPFLDKTDGVTPETAITVTSCKLTMTVDDGGVPTLVLDTAPTASGGANDMVHITGDDAGYYDLELAAANVNYLGRAKLAITDAATHCPVFMEFMILPAVVYDSFVLGTDVFQVDVAQFGGSNLTSASGIPEVKVASLAAAALTSIAAAVWDALTSGMSTVGSIGKKLADWVVGTIDTYTGNTKQTGDAYARLGAPAGASVSADVAAVKTDTGNLVTRITSTLFSGITSLKEWLGLIAGKQTGNSTARTELRATGAGSGTYDETTDSQEAIRDNMGTAQTGDGYAILNNGTYGLSALKTLIDDLPTNAELATALASADDAVLAAIAALNNLSQANIRTALGMASANLDTQLDALPTNAELATALGTADDAVLAAIAALNNLSAAQVNAEVDTAIADAALATAAALATVSAKLGAITGTGANTILGILKAMASKTATLPSDIGGTYDNATDALEAIRDRGDSTWGAGAVPTVGEIADAVWDEVASGHNTAGTTGAKLNSAASAGDPWSTALPGAYAAGEAGYIIGNNIDAQISDLLGQGSDTIIVGNSDDCADVQVFDAGERKPIGGRLDSTNGTFTISGVLCYMADADGNAVYGVNGLAATGYDTGSQTSPSFWYDLNTASPPSAVAMAVGTYDFWFKVTGTTSEGLTRVHEVHIVVQVV